MDSGQDQLHHPSRMLCWAHGLVLTAAPPFVHRVHVCGGPQTFKATAAGTDLLSAVYRAFSVTGVHAWMGAWRDESGPPYGYRWSDDNANATNLYVCHALVEERQAAT